MSDMYYFLLKFIHCEWTFKKLDYVESACFRLTQKGPAIVYQALVG